MFRTRDLHLALFMTLALTAFAALPIVPDAPSLLCIALASGGMYLFCHRRYGRLGALLAGLVYAYSPHLLLARGDWRELLALALLPLLLWRVDALRDKPSGFSFLPVFLLQAALLAAHASSFWLTLLAVGWLCFEMTIQTIHPRVEPAARASQFDCAAGAAAGHCGWRAIRPGGNARNLTRAPPARCPAVATDV